MRRTCQQQSWYTFVPLCPFKRLRTNPTQIQELEQHWAEPLHEYSQFASIIKKLLAYRHQKHVQYEMTQEGLETKRDSLEDMEKSEAEARRLDDALSRGRLTRSEPSSTQVHNPPVGEGVVGEDPVEGEDGSIIPPSVAASHPASRGPSYLPPHPGPNPGRRRSRPPGSGFLSALSYTLQGMIDVDPETARRNGITKTRESISQVSLSLSSGFRCIQQGFSMRMHFIFPPKISNTRVRQSRPTWIGSSARKSPTFKTCV